MIRGFRLLAALLLAGSAGLLVTDGMASERVVHRIVVPPGERQEAEVRVVERDGVVVVQTVIHSKVLRRVVGKIVDKESRHWPADRADHDQAVQYLAALRDVLAQIRQQPRATDATDQRRSMVIEFRPDAGVLVSGARVRGAWDDVRVEELLPPTTVLELSASYIETNMQLIVADSFAVPSDEARAMLESAIP